MLCLSLLFMLGILSVSTAAVIGFGIGSLLTPLLLTRLDPTLAVAAVALPHLIATAVRYLQHRCVVGTLLGEKVFLGLPRERYRRVVGAAVGVLGVWLLVRALTF